MTPEQIEQTCADLLLKFSHNMADAYVTEPEDYSASVTALLARTLEIHLNRPINLENLYKWPKNPSSDVYKMDR